MVISELVSDVKKIIGTASDSADLDARIIVKFVTGLDDVHLVVDKNKAVNDEMIVKAKKLAVLRSEHMPVSYITGSKEFMSLDFFVETGVLIPRPDTECIVEEAVKLVSSGKILDIGTGSGAIAVSLAHYVPAASVTAIDISDSALRVAGLNALKNNVDIQFIKADIFSYNTDDRFDLIISNPPYIEKNEIKKLDIDVRCYEPVAALDGGADGLDFYRRITDFAVEHLNPGGYLVYEFGWQQHDSVRSIIENAGLKFVDTIYDISGIKRGCSAQKI